LKIIENLIDDAFEDGVGRHEQSAKNKEQWKCQENTPSHGDGAPPAASVSDLLPLNIAKEQQWKSTESIESCRGGFHSVFDEAG
jgi:hypothetical protein